MIAILSGLPEEIRATVDALENPVDESFAGRELKRGRLDGVEVLVGYTGVGKVLAAMTVQGVIERFHCGALLFTGIAGSLNPEYEIGDVIIATDSVQHDFDVTLFGLPRGGIPNENLIELASAPALVDYALRWKPQDRRVHRGRILSGDRFVSSRGESTDSFLIDELEGDAVDMESAAAALVAHLNGIPFLLMRIISDKADGVIPGGFRSFLIESSALIRDFSRYMTAYPEVSADGD